MRKEKSGEFSHGLPDEKSVSEESARAAALAWQGANIPIEEPIVCTYYSVFEPEKPVWVFYVYDKSLRVCEVIIDAYTGEIISAADVRGTNG